MADLKFLIRTKEDTYFNLITFCKSQSRERGVMITIDMLFERFANSLINKNKEKLNGMERDPRIARYSRIRRKETGARVSLLLTQKERGKLEAVGYDGSSL